MSQSDKKRFRHSNVKPPVPSGIVDDLESFEVDELTKRSRKSTRGGTKTVRSDFFIAFGDCLSCGMHPCVCGRELQESRYNRG